MYVVVVVAVLRFVRSSAVALFVLLLLTVAVVVVSVALLRFFRPSAGACCVVPPRDGWFALLVSIFFFFFPSCFCGEANGCLQRARLNSRRGCARARAPAFASRLARATKYHFQQSCTIDPNTFFNDFAVTCMGAATWRQQLYCCMRVERTLVPRVVFVYRTCG